jgi:hypothetical protein
MVLFQKYLHPQITLLKTEVSKVKNLLVKSLGTTFKPHSWISHSRYWSSDNRTEICSKENAQENKPS